MEKTDNVLYDTKTDNLYPALFQAFAIIFCGYVAGRLNLISSVESKGISTFVGTFALPSLIFLSLARLDFSTVNWMFLLAVTVGKGIVFFAVIIVTVTVSKPVNLGRAGIFAIFCTVGNDFALGYPIMVLRESVSVFNAGSNESETVSLSTYAFLYGTIPTTTAVFVFSNLYQLKIDLVASTMVICTFLSAPMMFMSAELISINKDFADQLKAFCFDLSIVSLVAILWVIAVFTVTKKYKRMPHRMTLCLVVSQLLLAVSIICGGPMPNHTSAWPSVMQQTLRIFSMYSCLLWTAMLSVGLVMLQSHGPCFVVILWPVLAFVAWGAPAVMIAVLLVTKDGAGNINSKAIDAVRLCILVFCLTVTVGSLIVYIRFRRRSARIGSPTEADISPSDETRLINNSQPTSSSLSINGNYGTMTSVSSNSDNTNGNGLSNSDTEAIAINEKESSQKQRCSCCGPCSYLVELEVAAGQLGLLPAEQSRGRGSQLLRHTGLIIINSLTMFLGITYTTWIMTTKDQSGVFVEIEFLDVAAIYGQGLVMFILFGLDPQEIFLPAIRFLKKKWYGTDTLVLTAVEDLGFETKHVCDQFITYHLERCKEAIAEDKRYGMRLYCVFRGSCLVRWLVSCGLAKDDFEAIQYGRHLLEGRIIAHINNAHHFTNSAVLYTFNIPSTRHNTPPIS